MYNGRILVATDGSPHSERAAATAIGLAAAVKAKVVAFTAIAPYPYAAIGESSGVAASDYQTRAGAAASERLAAIEAQARAAGVDCHTSMLEDEQPYRAIIAAADKHDCGLIVMASHGSRGVLSLMLGSETQRVLTHSSRPVLVVR